MAKSIFTSFDNLTLQEIETEAELIPLLTPEDEEALRNEELPTEVAILPLRNTVLFSRSRYPHNCWKRQIDSINQRC